MAPDYDLPSPSHDERTTAMLARLLMIFTWFIGPLILYLVKRESRFVAFHSLQALIFQAFCSALSIVMMVSWFLVMIGTAATQGGSGHPSGPPPVAFFVTFGLIGILWMGVWVLTLVLGIVYTIKATNGEWAGYPLIGRWARHIVLGRALPTKKP